MLQAGLVVIIFSGVGLVAGPVDKQFDLLCFLYNQLKLCKMNLLHVSLLLRPVNNLQLFIKSDCLRFLYLGIMGY